MRKNFILLISSILIFFFITELFFNFIEPKSPQGTTYGVPFNLNDDSLRDKNYIKPKPKDIYRILVLGDSWTWGLGLQLDQTIPKQLETSLSNKFNNITLEVINAAKLGFNTVQQKILFEEVGLSYQPDLVILIYNLNDIEWIPSISGNNSKDNHTNFTPVVEIDKNEDILKWYPNKEFRRFVWNLEQKSSFIRFLVPRLGVFLRDLGLLNSVEFSWVEKIYQGYNNLNPGWIASKTALNNISNICKKNNTQLIVAVYPLLIELDNYKGIQAHNTIINVWDSLKISCHDLYPIFKNKKPRKFGINHMDGHPNANAHSMVTKELLPLIESIYYLNKE